MSIGIGGAGSKLASLLDEGSGTIINVSDVELSKVAARHKIRAVVHSPRGRFKGARKEPAIGRTAFTSISEELQRIIGGEVVFSSAGGGTGNGLTSVLLEKLSEQPLIAPIDKTLFALLLPFPEREAGEFVDNTIQFLSGPVSTAIDAGNTGNIFLFSNQFKFKNRLPEAEFNQILIHSFRQFLAIPGKAESLDILDGHIDYEDFSLYQSRPYFNHFCQFDYDPEKDFGEQLSDNYNPLLLTPAGTIEALFLLEVPDPAQTPTLYSILDFFAADGVAPTYSVLHNPNLNHPLITVSLLYSRKPLELVDDFTSISERHKRTRIKKSLDQYVTLQKLHVDLEGKAREIVKEDNAEEDILTTLKRLGKL